MLERVSVFIYGSVSYVSFLLTFSYAVAFVGNFGVPLTLDGALSVPLGNALLTDVVLLSLFSVQHSLMARPFFKRWLTRLVPQPAERSTYVLASSVALALVFVFWQPLGGLVWDVQTPFWRTFLYVLFAVGWLLIVSATFLIDHFDLFGMRQVWLHLMNKPYACLTFATPGLYKWVRHPLYLGWLLAFWSTPTMTGTHLCFASLMSVYILTAVRLEERDLVQTLGDDYRRYRERVPMILPFTRRKGVAKRELTGHAARRDRV